jgi:hypothetical protein
MVRTLIRKFIFRKPKLSARRYINKNLSVKELFEKLNDRKIDYVVLRWFENLPIVEKGEDIDMLISDSDIDRIDDLFTRQKNGSVPCDIYSISGHKGTSYKNISYFPSNMARRVLANSRLIDGIYRVPSLIDHFFTMSYHALYHKGYASGLKSEGIEKTDNCKIDHDYVETISKLSIDVGFSLNNMTMESLDALLEEHGWKPQRDTLEKLSPHNDWIKDYFFSNNAGVEDSLKGLSTFLIRESGVLHISKAKEILRHDGFEILFEKPIKKDVMNEVSNKIRGGNWSKGPWPRNGGLPAYVIIAYDPTPTDPPMEMLKKHPGLTNRRVYKTKYKIRDNINSALPHDQNSNPVHSSDNAEQALEYINITSPELLDSTIKTASEIYRDFKTPYTVVRSLGGHSRRAKVEKVLFNGNHAVCKTFKRGCERFMERELKAREVGDSLQEMTKILEVGANYIVMEYIENNNDKIINKTTGFYPLWVLKRSREIIIHFRSQGYDYIDFCPQNIIYNEKDGLKIIDFEFLQPGIASKSIEGNFSWHKVPPNFSGDLPSSYKDPFTKWKRAFGLPRFMALHDYNDFIYYNIRTFYFLIFRTLESLIRTRAQIAELYLKQG